MEKCSRLILIRRCKLEPPGTTHSPGRRAVGRVRGYLSLWGPHQVRAGVTALQSRLVLPTVGAPCDSPLRYSGDTDVCVCSPKTCMATQPSPHILRLEIPQTSTGRRAGKLHHRQVTGDRHLEKNVTSALLHWGLPAMRETRARSLGLEDPLEEELATPSSILTWKVLWTWEPGRPESLGLPHRVRYD